jgi:hypothetical protein
VRHRANWRILLVLILISIGCGCSLDARSRGPFGPEDPQTAVPRTPLLSRISPPHVLEFTGDDVIGHMKPKMAGTVLDTSVRRSQNSSATLTTAEVAALRKAAEGDARVTALLGSRWGFIDVDRLPPEGKVSFGCCRDTARLVRLIYYSYSNNVSVEVRMKETNVLSTARIERYLPREGPEDVQRGIELAKADPRLAGKVQPLEGHGPADATR